MTTLYQQVSNQILDAIQSGTLKVGDRLPPEADYAADLGVSRSTLRLAFDDLERSGVLQRRKRLGTRIIADRPKPRFNMATTGIYELLSLGRDTELAITKTSTIHQSDVTRLEGYESETGYWLEVTGTRSLAGENTPFNLSHVYVPARYAGIEPVLGKTETSVFQVIEESFGISVGRVSQTARAVACPLAVAQVLGLEEHAPVLLIEAQLLNRDGQLMEISVAYFDPDRFQLATDVEIE